MHNRPIVIIFTVGLFFCLTQVVTSTVSSSYSGSLTQNSGVYFRPGQTSNSYYYQAIELTFSTIATYTFRSNGSLDTYGYLYSVSFDPLYPTRNLIASDDDSGGSGQFLFNATLTFGTRYILVVTTFYPGIIGAYSITTLGPSSVNFFPLPPPTTTAVPSTTTSGPAPVFPSTYTSSLSASSETFIRPGKISGTYRYEAIRVAIYTSTSGRYTFRSNSSLDTYGYLYNGSFNPFNPSLNLIASDDDSGGSGQFLFNVTLTYDNVYILVVTTYSPNVTGVYTVTALGPASVYFFPLVTTTTTASTTTSQAQVPSYYSSSLSQNSGIYTRSGQSSGSYYYESIQVVLYSSARYILRSSSTLDTYGYLYSGSFDPLNPSLNLIAFDDDSGGDRQFLLNVTLIYGTRYILVVTTYNPSVTGPYGVAVLGPSSVYFLPYNPTTVAPTTTTTAPSVPSSYSDALSSSSGIYTRPGQTSNAYYYQAIGVIVYTSGKYTFRSSSALDTYGYFYSSSFDSSNPLQNLIASDDDSGGDRQFLLNVTLTYGTRYILVVTTYAPNTAGSFSINSLGPAIVSWNEIPPTFGFALDAVEISFVAISCIVFLGIILSACAYRRSRQRTINRTAVYLTSDRKTQPNSSVVSETVGMPYVVSTNYARLSSGEKPSLSNE